MSLIFYLFFYYIAWVNYKFRIHRESKLVIKQTNATDILSYYVAFSRMISDLLCVT